MEKYFSLTSSAICMNAEIISLNFLLFKKKYERNSERWALENGILF